MLTSIWSYKLTFVDGASSLGFVPISAGVLTGMVYTNRKTLECISSSGMEVPFHC